MKFFLAKYTFVPFDSREEKKNIPTMSARNVMKLKCTLRSIYICRKQKFNFGIQQLSHTHFLRFFVVTVFFPFVFNFFFFSFVQFSIRFCFHTLNFSFVRNSFSGWFFAQRSHSLHMFFGIFVNGQERVHHSPQTHRRW